MQDVEQQSPETLPEPPPPDRKPARRRRTRGRVLWSIGLVLILSALGVGGYTGWLLWGTGLTTRAAQADLREDFELKIDTKEPEDAPIIVEEPAPTPTEEQEEPRVVQVPGEAVAILRIPAIELNYVVVEGTDTESLKKGPGHYSSTAYPWEDSGRVGIAGHRTTYGAPFWSLNELRPGDRIVLATEYGVFTYRVTGSRVVLPTNSSVLGQTDGPTLVLTTCTPRFSAARRLIVFADRVN